jgi:hypothetical protein
MSIGKQKAKVNHYAIGSRVYERLKKEYSEFLTDKKQSIETKNPLFDYFKQGVFY